MLPLIRFAVKCDNEVSDLRNIFDKTMHGFYSSIDEEWLDKDFLEEWLFTWLHTMWKRRSTLEKPLSKGEWDEYYISSKYSGNEIKAMIVFTS